MNEGVNWLSMKKNVIYYSVDHIKAYFNKGLSTLPLFSPQPIIGSTLKNKSKTKQNKKNTFVTQVNIEVL